MAEPKDDESVHTVTRIIGGIVRRRDRGSASAGALERAQVRLKQQDRSSRESTSTVAPFTVEGNSWLSQSTAAGAGFSTTAAKTFTNSITWSPSADVGTSQMLNSVIYQSAASFSMSQTISNGQYDVYFWLTHENYANNARSENIKLEGATVASGVGSMAKNTWVKYGPYTTTVNDGTLNIEAFSHHWRPAGRGTSHLHQRNHNIPNPHRYLIVAEVRIVMSTDFPPLDVCIESATPPITQVTRTMSSPWSASSCTQTSSTFWDSLLLGHLCKHGPKARTSWTSAGQVLPGGRTNLRKPTPVCPTASCSCWISLPGLSGTWGQSVANNIGSGKDSEASNAIVWIIDEPTREPVSQLLGRRSNLAQGHLEGPEHQKRGAADRLPEQDPHLPGRPSG